MRTSLRPLSDANLTRGLDEAIAREDTSTSVVLAYVAEFDHRKLYLPAGYPSMFEYCVGKLRRSEAAAYKRIRAGRAARRFPAILDAVEAGRLHLAGVVLLAPHLTQDNAAELIEAATHKTKAEIEWLLAQCFPKPDFPARVVAIVPRSRPTPELAPERTGDPVIELAPGPVSLSEIKPAEPPAAQVPLQETAHPPRPVCAQDGPRPTVIPLSPGRYGIKFTVGQETLDKLERVQALLSHRIPSGDLAQVFDRALDAIERELEKEIFAATESPRASSRRSLDPRHIPAHVRRAVRERDGDQCTFVSADGHRCASRKFLEFDHVDPVARGGLATVDRLRLRCRAHNQYEAERVFGREFMDGKREASRRARARSA